MNPIASPIAIAAFVMGIFMLVIPPVGVGLIIASFVIQGRYLKQVHGGRRHRQRLAQQKAQEKHDREYDAAIAWMCR